MKLPTPVKKGQGGQPDSNALQGLRILRRRSEIVLRLDVDVAFDSAADAVNPDADEMITVIAGALKDRPVGIRVEGHTDNRPISTAKYRSNWHLSTARATSIINQFVAHGMDPKQLSASGYADNHPVASNSTEEGRAKNRRVDIVVSLAQNESTMLESGTEMREDLDQGMESAKPDDQAKPGK